jgi:hypothetical protein
VPTPPQGMILGPVRLIPTLTSRPVAPTAPDPSPPATTSSEAPWSAWGSSTDDSGAVHASTSRTTTAQRRGRVWQGRAVRCLNPNPHGTACVAHVSALRGVPASPSTDDTPAETALPPGSQCAAAPLGCSPPWLRMRVAQARWEWEVTDRSLTRCGSRPAARTHRVREVLQSGPGPEDAASAHSVDAQKESFYYLSAKTQGHGPTRPVTAVRWQLLRYSNEPHSWIFACATRERCERIIAPAARASWTGGQRGQPLA